MLYSVEVPAPTSPDRFYEGTVYWFETYNQVGAHMNAAVGADETWRWASVLSGTVID